MWCCKKDAQQRAVVQFGRRAIVTTETMMLWLVLAAANIGDDPAVLARESGSSGCGCCCRSHAAIAALVVRQGAGHDESRDKEDMRERENVQS